MSYFFRVVRLEILFSCIALLIPITVDSQQATKNKNFTPQELIIKVSQFGQFVKRFNYEEDFWGKPMSPSFTKKINRYDYISLLFNSLDKRLDSTNSAYSQEYALMKADFLKSVVANNYKINRISDTLYSEAVCEVYYHNRATTLHLILKQQNINNGIAWVIIDAFADFFYDNNNNKASKNFIPPTSNEVNYIHLNSLFENKDSLSSYAYPGYVCNRLSIFFQLIHSGDIQYKHVKYVRYFISDIPGWIICVKEFNREGMNSGWLIENIYINKTSIVDFFVNESNFAN